MSNLPTTTTRMNCFWNGILIVSWNGTRHGRKGSRVACVDKWGCRQHGMLSESCSGRVVLKIVTEVPGLTCMLVWVQECRFRSSLPASGVWKAQKRPKGLGLCHLHRQPGCCDWLPVSAWPLWPSDGWTGAWKIFVFSFSISVTLRSVSILICP